MPTYGTTPNLGLTEVGLTQNNKVTTLDTMAEGFDEAIAGTYSQNVTAGGTFTLASLTDSNGQPAWMNVRQKLTGSPGAGINLVVPLSNPRFYIVDNQCGQNVTIKGTTGTTVVLATGNVQIVYCDGTNVVAVTAPTTGASAPPVPIDIPFSIKGKPAASDYINYAFAHAITFPANFASANNAASAVGGMGALPTTGSWVITINKIPVSGGVLGSATAIGTITVTSGGSITYATTGGTAQTVPAGSICQASYPLSQDATAADPSFTLGGTR